MESQELIDAFKGQLDQVAAQGAEQVQIASLRAYLSALERDAGASQEYRQREHAGMLAHYAVEGQHSIEMLKAVLEAGKSALQSLVVINGGAVVALLGVMSNLVGKNGGGQFASLLALPLLLFGLGVLAGALGFAFRYFSQGCYSESTGDDGYKLFGNVFRYMAILIACAGYTLFGYAIFKAYGAVVQAF